MIIQKDFKEILVHELIREGIEPSLCPAIYSACMTSYAYFRFSELIPEDLVLQNMSVDDNKITFYWNSRSTGAKCPYCQILSTSSCKDYKTNVIQDIPQDKKAVFHDVRFQMFYCNNDDCTTGKFKEQFEGFCDWYYTCTNRFKAYCVKRGLACSAHRAAKELQEEGAVITDDTILNYIKTFSAKHLEASLNNENVKIIGIDDINLRKGDKSTGCTVFVDLETHKTLIIVLGTTTEAAKRVLEKFPLSEFCCNDRAGAYISAGKECNKTVVADRFHLVQNAQQAVKDALSASMPATIYIRSGNGWIKSSEDNKKQTCYTVSNKTLDDRIELAGLTPAKAKKYKDTIKILEIADKGLNTVAIATKLGIKRSEVQVLRRNAVDLIDEVEKKIETRLQKSKNANQVVLQGPGERAVKTVSGSRVKPSSDSIANPYRDTVLELWKNGFNHRTMHPILVEQGYDGSPNAIYQFILKVGKENPELNRKAKSGSEPKWMDDFDVEKAEERPELTLDKVSSAQVYKTILKEAKEIKDGNVVSKESSKETLSEESTENGSDCVKTGDQNFTNSKLSDDLKEVIFGTPDVIVEEKEDKAKKELKSEKKKKMMDTVKQMYPIIDYLVCFLSMCYMVFDSSEIILLDNFIGKYKTSDIAPVKKYVDGLIRDYECVKNCITYTNISNGPTEGHNNRIKMIKRKSFGRAGLELLNAYATLDLRDAV